MKRGGKITLIVLAVLVAVFGILFVCADVIISRLVQEEVSRSLANIPGCEASCGDIHVRFFSGTASVEDLHFSYRNDSLMNKDSVCPGVEVSVNRVDVGRIFYSQLLHKRVLISDVRIKRPAMELWMDEKNPNSSFPQLHDDTLKKMDDVMESFRLMNLRIQDVAFRLHSVRTKLDVSVDSLSLTAHELVYDSVFSYCDSVYRFELGTACVVTPDGRVRIETSDIRQSDQGAFEIGKTRIANTMPRKRLADIVKEPSTWIDMTIDSVITSPFNPIRKALAKDNSLESLKVVVEKMDIYRDERYAPKTPYVMPQDFLVSLPMTFKVGHLDAQVKQMDIEYASTNVNCGEMHLGNMHMAVDNVTNKRGATMRVSGGCPIQKGQAKAQATMTLNKACDFTIALQAKNINANYLNTFIRPLVGITFELQIDELDTHYAGNSEKVSGEFKLLYHGLNVQVHKDENIPYKIVTKNANTFTTLANTLLPKSNPTAVDIHPRAYKVEWKRDPWKPVALYAFGPCINGAVETLLPGLYVHKQVKE